MDYVPPEPAPTYLQLRQRILNLKPDELGLSPSAAAAHIWGILMEMGFAVGTATLVCLVDGTTSLHYSTGGGLLGRGDYLPIAEASKALVVQAESYLGQMTITKGFPLPETGQVSFIFLTYSGIYASRALDSSLASNQHLLSPLYKSAQEILSQLRLLAEKRG